MKTDPEIEELRTADLSQRCLEAALRLLSYRPRSEAEVRARLGRRFDGEIIDQVLLQLKEKQMIDDVAFAQFWRENRESFRPCSKRLLQTELKNKGVTSEVIDEVLEGIEDEENAYRAALRKGRTLEKDYDKFRQKLSPFLGRRGFSYDVIKGTIERLWHELNQLP